MNISILKKSLPATKTNFFTSLSCEQKFLHHLTLNNSAHVSFASTERKQFRPITKKFWHKLRCISNNIKGELGKANI